MRELFPMLASLIMTGCNLSAERPDLEPYSDPEVLEQIEVGQILNSVAMLNGRNIEVSGLVSNLGRNGLRWWGFQIGDGGEHELPCYERNWHSQRRGLLHQLLRLAAAEQRKIRVAGKLSPGPRLELDWIEYDGIKYDTDAPDTLHGTVL